LYACTIVSTTDADGNDIQQCSEFVPDNADQPTCDSLNLLFRYDNGTTTCEPCTLDLFAKVMVDPSTLNATELDSALDNLIEKDPKTEGVKKGYRD
jgi:hypothetical protein